MYNEDPLFLVKNVSKHCFTRLVIIQDRASTSATA